MKSYPEIVNIAVKEDGEINSFTFPKGTREYTLKARANNEFSISYTPDGPTMTIPAGASKTVSDLEAPEKEESRTVYISCDKSGEVIEIEFWK